MTDMGNIFPKVGEQTMQVEQPNVPEVQEVPNVPEMPLDKDEKTTQQVEQEQHVQNENKEVHDANNDISYEQKYKELQAEYAKSKQEIAAYAAKIAALEKAINPADYIDQEKLAELEELKFSNPDLWRVKLNELENEALAKAKAHVDNAMELERRKALIEDYNANNPDYQLTDYVVDFVLPRGIIAKLEKSEITFEAFLKEASEYLKKTTIGSKSNPQSTENAGKQAPITQVGGSGTTIEDASGADNIQWWL